MLSINPFAVYGVLCGAVLWTVAQTPWYRPYFTQAFVLITRARRSIAEGLIVALVWIGITVLISGNFVPSLIEGSVAALTWTLIGFSLGSKLQLTPPD